MSSSFPSRLLAIVLLLVGVGAIAIVAYNAGIDAGVASAGASAAGATTVHVVRGFGGFFPWFFFFPFGFIFFILLISLLFRAFGWHGRGHYGRGWSGRPGDPRWGGGRESPFEAWHRQAHQGTPGSQGQPPDGNATPGTPSGPR